jgi:hypothetical protein
MAPLYLQVRRKDLNMSTWSFQIEYDSDGVNLAFGQMGFPSESAAKEAGMAALDAQILSGGFDPERLVLCVIDPAGEYVSESRARRLTSFN